MGVDGKRSSDDFPNKRKQSEIEGNFMEKAYKNVGEKLKHLIVSSLYAAAITSLLFAVSPKKISKLEREIENLGKAAIKCLDVDYDTTSGVEYIIKGTEKCDNHREYNLYKKYIYPAVIKLDNTDFYNKKKGKIYRERMQIYKGEGRIEYPSGETFPYLKEKETEKIIKE